MKPYKFRKWFAVVVVVVIQKEMLSLNEKECYSNKQLAEMLCEYNKWNTRKKNKQIKSELLVFILSIKFKDTFSLGHSMLSWYEYSMKAIHLFLNITYSYMK